MLVFLMKGKSKQRPNHIFGMFLELVMNFQSKYVVDSYFCHVEGAKHVLNNNYLDIEQLSSGIRYCPLGRGNESELHSSNQDGRSKVCTSGKHSAASG